MLLLNGFSAVDVIPAYVALPSLVRYTNRPCRHQSRYMKRFTIPRTATRSQQNTIYSVRVSYLIRSSACSLHSLPLSPLLFLTVALANRHGGNSKVIGRIRPSDCFHFRF